MDFELIIERTKRKTITLKVLDAKTVKVAVPKACPERYILDFVNKKAGWIAKKRLEFQKEEVLLKNLTDFNKVMYLGALYDVRSSEKVKSVSFANGVFYVPDTDFMALKYKIKRFFVKTSQVILEKMLQNKSDSLNLRFNLLKTSVYKTKWGSCNSKKDIKLNAALIMLDKDIIDYVITHELCHLKHFNHSKAFWNTVENVMPDYKKLKTELKRYNYLLKILT